MPTYKYLNDTGLERSLSKLKTYIDSQSGGGSDGHGFIICDTSTMQVGDKIRVRSVYTVLEEQYNQTKEVVTVGQPVTFTVPCYDYYKICIVQDTSATAYVDIQQGLTGYEAKVSYSGDIKWQSETGTYEDNYIKLYRETANDDWTLKAVSTCVYDGNAYTSGQTIATLPYNQSTRYYIYATAPTEIGGVYKTVDYGQTLFINVLDKSTFRGIKGILNAGQATTQIQVGDEVHTLLEGADWVMQVADVSATRVTLASKYLWKTSTYSNAAKTYYSASSPIHDEITSFLAKLPQADQDCIETITKPQHTPVYQNSSWSTYSDKIWLPNTWEVLGDRGSIGNYYGTSPLPLTQFPLFTTQANRVKTLASGGTAYPWWTCDGNATSYGGESYQGINDLGNSAGYGRTVSNYLLPCCAIEADS